MTGRREWLALGAVVLLSTAFRAWAAVSVPVPWIAPDEMVYGLLGRSLYLHGSLAASLQDQQVAGVVMWGFGGAAALVGGCALFISWLESLDRATPGRGTVTSGPGTVATRPELG